VNLPTPDAHKTPQKVDVSQGRGDHLEHQLFTRCIKANANLGIGFDRFTI
jgi:hypothetical protein